MLLQAGQWLGRGSLLVEGASLGEPIECDLTIEQDSSGLTLTGALEFKRTPSNPLSIRVAPDEVGTYIIDARLGWRPPRWRRQVGKRSQPRPPVECRGHLARHFRAVSSRQGLWISRLPARAGPNAHLGSGLRPQAGRHQGQQRGDSTA